MKALFVALLLSFAGTVNAQDIPEDPDVQELLRATDDINRGESSHAIMEMYVKTERYERSMRMEAWSEGTEKTLVKITAPPKDAGMVTLKAGDNIWNYLPKVDRTMKVPAGMMSGSWMGSHFTNDDLVQESRFSEDYDAEITGRPDGSEGSVWEVTLDPKPDAPVVWGKVVVRVTPDKMPVDVRYYDEDGELVRTMAFSDYTEYGDRVAPAVMTLVPADEPDEVTRVSYETLEFNVEIPDNLFSLQSLKR